MQAHDQELPARTCVADFDIVMSRPQQATAAAADKAAAAAIAAARERLLAEAQTIKATVQVLDALPALGALFLPPDASSSMSSMRELRDELWPRGCAPFEVRLSHAVLLEGLMACFGVEPQATEQVRACRVAPPCIACVQVGPAL